MSKRIWRGRTWKGPGPRPREVWATTVKADETHTVVPDAALFPVKEARARVKCDDKLHTIGQRMSNVLFNAIQGRALSARDFDCLNEIRKAWDAVDRNPLVKYLAAVERLKKKASKS